MKPQNAPRPQFERRGAGQRSKLGMPKPKAWSHQEQLKELIGKKVILSFVQGGVGTFELVNADAFALQVRPSNSQSLLTYWKHALAGFQVAE